MVSTIDDTELTTRGTAERCTLLVLPLRPLATPPHALRWLESWEGTFVQPHPPPVTAASDMSPAHVSRLPRTSRRRVTSADLGEGGGEYAHGPSEHAVFCRAERCRRKRPWCFCTLSMSPYHLGSCWNVEWVYISDLSLSHWATILLLIPSSPPLLSPCYPFPASNSYSPGLFSSVFALTMGVATGGWRDTSPPFEILGDIPPEIAMFK